MSAKRASIFFSVVVVTLSVVARSDELQPPNFTCGTALALPDCTPTQACDTTVDTRECNACLFKKPFGGCAIRGNDPGCEAAKGAQNAAHAQSKAACEASKTVQKLRCEEAKASIMMLNSQRTAACKTDAPSTAIPSPPAQ